MCRITNRETKRRKLTATICGAHGSLHHGESRFWELETVPVENPNMREIHRASFELGSSALFSENHEVDL